MTKYEVYEGGEFHGKYQTEKQAIEVAKMLYRHNFGKITVEVIKVECTKINWKEK